jgi:hypothetical protein
MRFAPVGDDLFPVIDDTKLRRSIACFVQCMLIGPIDANLT